MGEKDSKLGCVGCAPGLSLNEGETLLMDGRLVQLAGLEEIMEQVRRMKLTRRKLVADELLTRVKSSNQVPVERERAYRNALMDEYDRRYLSIM